MKSKAYVPKETSILPYGCNTGEEEGEKLTKVNLEIVYDNIMIFTSQ